MVCVHIALNSLDDLPAIRVVLGLLPAIVSAWDLIIKVRSLTKHPMEFALPRK